MSETDPTDGNWSLWVTSECDVSCGIGRRSRTRYCDNPMPTIGGEDCLGNTYTGNTSGKQFQKQGSNCNTGVTCPPQDGNWGEWTDDEACSKTCGYGTQDRVRHCDNPPATNGGLKCLTLQGSREDMEIKQISCMSLCPIHGNWGQWQVTISCSATCGSGILHRNRMCNNPPASNGGSQCLATNGIDRESTETGTETCNPDPCDCNLLLFFI